MNGSPEAVLYVIDALDESKATYLVIGSLASNVYTPPRSTLDAASVVDMKPERLEQLFDRLGQQLDREPQMSFETVTSKLQHRFRHRESQFLIEIFEADMSEAHERARFERRTSGSVQGQTVYVPTAEDVIVQKLRWYECIRRMKDREDVRSVMVHQWDALDWSYIERWCIEHGTSALLNELREEARAIRES